jgi:hypothetical protein
VEFLNYKGWRISPPDDWIDLKKTIAKRKGSCKTLPARGDLCNAWTSQIVCPFGREAGLGLRLTFSK